MFEKHKLFLYKEDYDKFVDALQKVIDVARSGSIPIKETVSEEPQKVENQSEESFDISF